MVDEKEHGEEKVLEGVGGGFVEEDIGSRMKGAGKERAGFGQVLIA